MPYSVLVQGVPIECATQAEAISLAKAVAQEAAVADRRSRRASTRSNKNGAPVPPPGLFEDDEAPPSKGGPNGAAGARDGKRAWTPPEALHGFVARLSGQQKDTLGIVAMAKDEISLDAIRLALGLKDKREASVVLAACKRLAKSCDLDWGQIVEYRLAGKAGERQSLYKPGPLLRGEEA